jgi:hypothetical protein
LLVKTRPSWNLKTVPFSCSLIPAIDDDTCSAIKNSSGNSFASAIIAATVNANSPQNKRFTVSQKSLEKSSFLLLSEQDAQCHVRISYGTRRTWTT